MNGAIANSIYKMIKGNYDDLFILQVVGNTPGAQALLREARARYEREQRDFGEWYKDFVKDVHNNSY